MNLVWLEHAGCAMIKRGRAGVPNLRSRSHHCQVVEALGFYCDFFFDPLSQAAIGNGQLEDWRELIERCIDFAD